MHPFARYSLLRLLVFFGCLLVLWFIPPLAANPILLFLVAATVSMLISLFALAGVRDAASAAVAEKVDARVARKHAQAGVISDESAEDAEAGTSRPAPDPDAYR